MIYALLALALYTAIVFTAALLSTPPRLGLGWRLVLAAGVAVLWPYLAIQTIRERVREASRHTAKLEANR